MTHIVLLGGGHVERVLGAAVEGQELHTHARLPPEERADVITWTHVSQDHRSTGTSTSENSIGMRPSDAETGCPRSRVPETCMGGSFRPEPRPSSWTPLNTCHDQLLLGLVQGLDDHAALVDGQKDVLQPRVDVLVVELDLEPAAGGLGPGVPRLRGQAVGVVPRRSSVRRGPPGVPAVPSPL